MKKGLKIGLFTGLGFLVAGFILTIVFGYTTYESTYTYTNEEEIHTLIIDSDISSVNIRTGSNFHIETQDLPRANEDGKRIQVKQSESNGVYTFKTKFKGKKFMSKEDVEINVWVPESVKVIQVQLNVGELEMENVHVDTLDVRADVGDVSFENVTARTVKCTNNLGDIEFDGDFTETMDMQCNVGDVEIELLRPVTEYAYDVNCKVGKFEIENGMGTNNPNATSKLTCRLDVGNCEIEFR